ncbi:hypothetical protein U1Q18_040407 [Sarracenia purpurea var. burkii]
MESNNDMSQHTSTMVCCCNPMRILIGHSVFSWFKTCVLLHMYRHFWWIRRLSPQSVVFCNSRELKFGARVLDVGFSGWGFLFLLFILLGGLVVSLLDALF